MATNGNRPGKGAAHSVSNELPEGTEPSRHPTPTQADILADLAARIRKVTGVTRDNVTNLRGAADDESERRRRSNIHNAQETCAQCAKCGCALAADAAVWRQQLRIGRGLFGGMRYTVAPVCEQCRSEWREYRGPRPCENCGRLVHQEYNFRRYRRTFCCEVCERAVRVAAARDQRSEARGTRECQTCGETFEPARTDARYCSSVCRQRAYRGRAALRITEGERGETFVSRNAARDLAGRRFGRWLVLGIHPEQVRQRRRWLCRCDCGAERIVRENHLRHGASTSCGCLRQEKARESRTTHGHTCGGKRTPAYSRWCAMLRRCRNPNATHYSDYGGRGIDVCERWLDFKNFHADMGDPPDGKWIDRIDNNGNYEPGNCRWTTPSVQRANQRPPKRKRRRSSTEQIRAFADGMARAGSVP